MRKGLFLFLLLSFSAAAQYSGPGVDTCLAYARKDVTQWGAKKPSVVFDRDANLIIERYTRKAGSQFVSSLLLGNGALVYPEGVAVEMSFICLLASYKQAVFFDWRPRRDASVLVQCRRGSNATACLENLLQVAERDLTELYSRHFIDARQADAAAGNENAVAAFRKSADAFKAYRDAECGHRNSADERTACMVELTRRRELDLR